MNPFKELRRPKALHRISEHTRLTEVYRLEEKAVEDIIDKGLDCVNTADHWQNYEDLKKAASNIVGPWARQPKLRTTMYYDATIDFIDWLLEINEKTVIFSKRSEYDESEFLT